MIWNKRWINEGLALGSLGCWSDAFIINNKIWYKKIGGLWGWGGGVGGVTDIYYPQCTGTSILRYGAKVHIGSHSTGFYNQIMKNMSLWHYLIYYNSNETRVSACRRYLVTRSLSLSLSLSDKISNLVLVLSQEPREAAELEKPDSRRRRQSLVEPGV